MFDRSLPGASGALVALVLTAALAAAACGGSTPAASTGGGGGGGGASPAASSGGGGGTTGGALTGKRVCEIVTLEQATEILGEAPPRGEASDDRLAKSHTCAYKPGPKLILQVQVKEGVATPEAFDAALNATLAMNPSLPRTPVEGIGEKAYFIERTEPPRGTRLYILSDGKMVLINIGREDVPLEALQDTAKAMAPAILDAL